MRFGEHSGDDGRVVGEAAGMKNAGFGRPSDDHHGGCLVGLDQLDCDRFGAGELAAGQLGNFWTRVLAPLMS